MWILITFWSLWSNMVALRSWFPGFFMQAIKKSKAWWSISDGHACCCWAAPFVGAAWWHKAHSSWVLTVMDEKKPQTNQPPPNHTKAKRKHKNLQTLLNVRSMQVCIPAAVAWLKPWHGACLYWQGIWLDVPVPGGYFRIYIVPEITGEVFYR